MSSPVRFPNSPLPSKPISGSRSPIKTAACLIIGDEILNGKTVDTNSHFFATYCFQLGIELKRIEVIADDEDEIIEASTRMVKNYDFVLTSGGIGPTHDDITYESLAKAFKQELEYHPETIHRMTEMNKHRASLQNQTPEQKKARDRMALFPAKAEVLFVDEELWVPIVRLENKLCILPGVPSLFRKLLEGLRPYLILPDESTKLFRHLIHTNMPESNIAPFLTELSKRVKPEGIRVGSYPSFMKGVRVSLIGSNVERVKEIGEEVIKALDGDVVENKVGEDS